jgi:23S rRNA (uracil1939-C5)-methyltransferase
LILDRGLDVAIAMEGAAPPPAARARVGEIVRTSAIARVTLGDDLLVQQGPARLTIDGAAIDVPPRAFLQASAEAEEAIARLVIAGVGKAKRIADLFSGLGTFALRLARTGQVAAYDSDPTSIAALTAAARAAPGRKPITATRRDLMREPLSRKELEGFDAVVLDPPRAGAKAQCEALARSVVPRVVMVSCNPATLARDMAILVEAGYAPGTVTPIDQFVWSGHVEAVVTLTRRAR